LPAEACKLASGKLASGKLASGKLASGELAAKLASLRLGCTKAINGHRVAWTRIGNNLKPQIIGQFFSSASVCIWLSLGQMQKRQIRRQLAVSVHVS